MTDEADGPAFPSNGVDKARASKAGHAFHEAWAARSALELLPPGADLAAITLEGFAVLDELDLSTGAVEIADLVRYYGHGDIARARRAEVVQFKYSIGSATVAVRAADLAKTLTKFAQADAELRARHGDALVERVVRYEFATNRPIHTNLIAAITATIAGASAVGDVGTQQTQIANALAEYAYGHASLLSRLFLIGGGGSLDEVERSIGRVLASWSEAGDPQSEMRLLKLRNLVRAKAGTGSETDKKIDRVAVLAELGVDDEHRLYPTEDAFPSIGRLIERPVVETAIELAGAGATPLIVHGSGGMGKTVLMQSLAAKLGSKDQVVLFDGFGAGRWRDPSDGRHRPEGTLVHLANVLASRGLCDILLPITDPTSLLRGFRNRLVQSIRTVRDHDATGRVVLILDAIDHAAIAAKENGTASFAHLLLRSLAVDPIEGVVVIASCRTERRAEAVGGAEHRELEIPAFTPEEATVLITARDPTATAVEIAALLTRSGRNPRCLDTFLTDGRPYDLPSHTQDGPATPADVLDALLLRRLEKARREARDRGAQDADIDLLLTGLALLPPPVPIDELAAAYGVTFAQVESFAADLAPLLERTTHGLMFRDEPTETLIRRLSGADAAGRDRVVAVLTSRQSVSSYAARALPPLLTSLGYVDELVALGFDERAPPSATKVSSRDIRMSRLVRRQRQ